MRTLLKLLILAVPCFFSRKINAQSAEPNPPRTTVRLSRDTFFFGAIEAGMTVYDSVSITNTGNQPYVIRSARATCDCAVLHLPSRSLKPGESSVVRFEFDSRSKSGPVRAGLVLYDNSAPNARQIIYLVGEVRPRAGRKNPWENR